MPARPTWFVIADAARAEALIKRRGGTGYDTVRTWENPDAHSRDAELGEDKPGRAFDSLGPQRSAIEPRETPKQAAKKDFARDLVADLEAAVASGEAEAVVLVAPPKFLGELRAVMPAALAQKVREEVAKDYTQLPRAELFARLDELRPVGAV